MPEKTFSQVFIVDVEFDSKDAVVEKNIRATNTVFGLSKSYIAVCVLLLVMLPLSIMLGGREDIEPTRQRFTSFPMKMGSWKGVDIGMEQQFIDRLKFDDYIIGNYSRATDRLPVNLYVAYYASQRKGASAHSPKSCMPGDGWRIGDFEQRQVSDLMTAKGSSLIVNRTVISKGNSRQLVYYWFQQRGRIITNEYLVKLYLFWDALTQQRTDGALVRLVLTLPEGSDEAEADKKMADFLITVFPTLEQYVPS